MSLIHIDAIDEGGAHREVLIERDRAPKMGEWFEDEGVLLQRVPSVPMRPRVKNYRFTSPSLPNKKYAKRLGFTEAPHYDKNGMAAFASRRELVEYVSRHNDNEKNGTQLQWDPDGND